MRYLKNGLKKFGLYNIDVRYLEILHEQDSEVRYSKNLSYEHKPYVGVVVMCESYKYFIPLTSAKPKHVGWKNVSKTHYLVYEMVEEEEIRDTDIIKRSENGNIKILSALEINKMIPIPLNCFERIDFNKLQDDKYRALLLKEFLFLQNVQDGIYEKSQKIYNTQIQTGKIFNRHCNFRLLEKICTNWKN